MVKASYKQTEIGLIPEDWEVKKIGETCNELIQGINTAIDKPEYSVDGIPILKANDVIDGKIDLNNCDYITIKSFSKYNERFYIKKGDFLLSNIGARLGTGSIYKFDTPSTYAWNVMRISVNQNYLNQNYFAHFVNSPFFNNIILSNQSGSGMGFVPKSTLINFPVIIPPLPEQTAIAEALSDADAWIESLEQLIAKKRLLKQGAMQTLLTPPSHAEPDEAWEVKKLGEVCEFKNGAAHENVVDENGEYIIVNSKFISQEGNVRKYSNAFLCPLYKDEIVMVMSDIPNGKALAKCYIIEENNKYTLNQRICAFYPKQNFDSMFLYYKINRNEYFLSFDSGSGQTNLRKDEVLNCPIDFPNYQEQTRIATILSDMDAELEALEAQLQKAKQMKQGMMQELLTGRTRLV